MEYRIKSTPDIASNRMVIDVGDVTPDGLVYRHIDTLYIGNISEEELGANPEQEIVNEFTEVCTSNAISIFEALTNRLRQIIATIEYKEEVEGLAVDDSDDDTTDGY